MNGLFGEERSALLYRSSASRVPTEDLENRAGLEERCVEARGDREGLVVVGQRLLELLLGRKDAGPEIVRQVGIRVPGDQGVDNFLLGL